MNRKHFFESLLTGNKITSSKSMQDEGDVLTQKTVNRRTNTGISEYTGTFGDAELMHLLRRSLFGVSMGDIKKFKGKTLTQVVDTLLTPAVTQPNPPGGWLLFKMLICCRRWLCFGTIILPFSF